MQKVNVFDTTLRDGEQSAGVNLNTVEKVEIAKQLEKFGVDIMEAGFPASSKGDFEAVEKIAKTIRNSSVTGLARAYKQDIDVAWDALKHSAEPRIHIFLATSPIHMQYKLRKTPDEVAAIAVEAVKYAKQKFPLVQWSAEDATRSDKDFLVRIITEVINAGANVINLPDTVGYTTPKEYGAMYDYIREHVPNIDKVILSAHCHDDLGMATANTLSAIEHGVLQVEGTINGIGERAGNVALEEVAVALHIRQDYYNKKTRLKLDEIKRTSQLVSKLTGMVVPGNKAVVGANAFAHESGIHQDGVLKEASTYEIITPELVGFSSNRLVLGKHSGRHAFKERAAALGFDLGQEKLNEAFKAFKALTDKKKEVTDDDLFAILAEKQTDAADAAHYELESVQVQYGTLNIPTATVRIKTPEGTLVEEAGTGSGSVEAIYHTITKLFDGPIELKDYKLQSVGSGQDALADAFVKVKCGEFECGGRGSAQDVLEASAKSFLNAINRAHAMEQQSRKQVQV
ncbi:2-isopropylmalate synthase [Heyndrickxia coagulans]|uniref:2-isopropylmalate synthase n=1 Tax=Heyndrickxia coagulans DSM 1 = ATCC 7050 TaxID=1121088 RepID=A0A8B4BQR5_HEYCO|nr:2-isopropylmalate synthase [Heyndrickxia coagulans]AJH78869.1 2-isopropylmalate synthase [Heyndrickxia coagulans DSM 1 = ATCC 7050]MCR2845763.1 2-isopropylmalate synthase [Heyndrickxia coagulans]MDR4223377.1 2-isopropylmalate synthase [Heyndrickxia coagulans DSM 1 = ATCC 7050]MED4494544.1 2-isopropylmalate synthase [Heyndrickxia coagulans]MED4535362.1 2-isopropylmalate synthase [Heyndrickxia coagulans]